MLAFSGVLFIDVNSVPPRTWQARADELLNPDPDVLVTITRRRLDLAAFKATGPGIGEGHKQPIIRKYAKA